MVVKIVATILNVIGALVWIISSFSVIKENQNDKKLAHMQTIIMYIAIAMKTFETAALFVP